MSIPLPVYNRFMVIKTDMEDERVAAGRARTTVDFGEVLEAAADALEREREEGGQ